MRVVVDENMPAVESLLGDAVEVVRVPGRGIDQSILKGADALLVRSVTRVTAPLLQGTGVRFVGTATAGTEHIDCDGLREAGIMFASAPGANANSVVEYVLAAIAAVDDTLERLLTGASVGIIGFGHVGRLLAGRLGDLGVRCLAYDPWLSEADMPCPGTLDEVLDCAVISVHAALTSRTPWPSFHLLGRDRLARIGEHQLLINASRGAVVDNAALLDRLRSPASPQVVLDVWEGEPAISASLLMAARLGTPHIAGYSADAKVAATRMLCQAMVKAAVVPSLQASGGLPALPPILLSEQGSAGVIRQLMAASYPIERDDRWLREQTIGASAADAAAGFDRLRKGYPERRELLARKVVLPPGRVDEFERVAALGCLPMIAES